MAKVLFFAVSLLALAGTYCIPPPFFPFGGILSPFDHPPLLDPEMPDGLMLVDKFNKSGCLKEEIGDYCPFNYTYMVYRHEMRKCVSFVYGGCINNTKRVYRARECHGRCVLSPNRVTATTQSDSVTTNPATLTSNTAIVSSNPIQQSSMNTATESGNTATTSAALTGQTSTT